jgi:hypothetical protein
MNRSATLLALVLLVFATGGSACPWMRTAEVLPVTMPETATLEQLTAAVNDNTARIQSLNATQATISLPGAPAIPVTLALEPPLRFRLRASTVLTSTLVDVGSNDELFWLWIRQNSPPAMYYCRHDQFAGSAAQQLMPVEPQWIVEALGLVRFDPINQPQGPMPVGSGRVQIRSIRHSSIGDMSKVTVVDPARGIVLEQDLYDTSGRLIAAARTSNHHRDPISGAIVPRHIEIDYPGAQLTMKLDVADWQVNSLGPQNAALWTKPQYPGYPDVNLADRNQFGPPGGFAPPAPSAMPPRGPTTTDLTPTAFAVGLPAGAPSAIAPSATAPSAWSAPPESSGSATSPPGSAVPAAYRSSRFMPYP